MNREDAIKIFNTLLVSHKVTCTIDELEEVCKMALTALEQAPTSQGLISFEILDKGQLENSIEMLKILKEQARESGANTFVWDVTKESFDFVIDKTIKELCTVLEGTE